MARRRAVLSADNSIPQTGGCTGMWRPGIIARGLRATGLAAALLLGTPVPAQEPPGPADAMSAYQVLARWVRNWEIPQTEGGRTPGNPAGVFVTLRHNGAIVGRGTDVSGAPDGLRRAAGQALAEATERLPIERDALFEQNRRAVAGRITISLELAGALVPFAPAEYSDAAAECSPGLDGVAARFGDRAAAIFPSTTLASGLDGGRALAAAISKATGDPARSLRRPADLSAQDGAVFYRFRVVHLAQPSALVPPIFLQRGGRVVTMREMSEAELRRWADGLAEHLLARAWPGVEKYGLQGTYDPVRGAYENAFASPVEQAIALSALAQYLNLRLGSEARTEEDRERLRSGSLAGAVVRLHESLMAVEPGEQAPWSDPVAAAAAYSSARTLQFVVGETRAPVNEETWRLLGQSFEEAFAPERGWAPAIPESARALVAATIAGRSRDGTPDADRHQRQAEAMIRSLYREAPAGGLVAHMPWLGLAELHGAAVGDRPIPSAVALREMRELVWSHQLQAGDLKFEQRDLAGGIVFTSARNPLPSWQSVRPLAFIAVMLGDGRLTDPEEVPAELARLLTSLRFLRQLSAAEAEGHMYADPDRAMWGVRISLWDQRMPVDASALTLMTVCDTLWSLRRLEARRSAGR